MLLRQTPFLAEDLFGNKSLLRAINVPLRIDGINIYPGAWLYADADGVIIAPQKLK